MPLAITSLYGPHKIFLFDLNFITPCCLFKEIIKLSMFIWNNKCLGTTLKCKMIYVSINTLNRWLRFCYKNRFVRAKDIRLIDFYRFSRKKNILHFLSYRRVGRGNLMSRPSLHFLPEFATLYVVSSTVTFNKQCF